MGGAASVCVQYSDGSRDSYAAYGRGMSIIANHSTVLFAKTDEERDAAAKAVFQRENESYSGQYFERHCGLAPDWYGLVFIDLKGKKLWDCQGYTTVRHFSAVWDYANDYAENIERLAEGGILQTSLEYGVGSGEQASAELVRSKKCADGIGDGTFFWVDPPGWEYINNESLRITHTALKAAGYILTDQEEAKWQEEMKDR